MAGALMPAGIMPLFASISEIAMPVALWDTGIR
jgi:hypothetical protein